MEKMGGNRSKQIKRDEEFVDQIPDYDLLCKEMFRVLKKILMFIYSVQISRLENGVN